MGTYISTDTIWESIIGAENFESYRMNFVPVVVLPAGFPKEISKEIAIILKLIEHSYFEYDFIDLAFIHSIMTLEKSLRYRYKIEEGRSTKEDFYRLIERTTTKETFSNKEREIIHFLREYRNRQIHEPNENFGGIVLFGMLKYVPQLIIKIIDPPN
jgi:hypothetical protein